jgi:hypothetical protein
MYGIKVKAEVDFGRPPDGSNRTAGIRPMDPC